MKHGSQIALYCPVWKMFVKMSKNGTMGCSPVVQSGVFPKGWESEIFELVEIKVNSYALWSPVWKMFVKMNNNGTLGCSPIVESGIFPKGWESEIFEIVEIKENLHAFWSPTWKMFIKMNKNGTMGCSPSVERGIFPIGWESEIFEVVVVRPNLKGVQSITLSPKPLKIERNTEKIDEKALRAAKKEEEKNLKEREKEQEKLRKEEEKRKEKEAELSKHKLKSSRGEIYCVFCGMFKSRTHVVDYCSGRINDHNYVFMKDKKDRWELLCNKCGKSRSYAAEYCS
jgi:hypothetical protein